MLIRAPKREKIEAKLGRSLESFLKEKLAEEWTTNRISRKVHLDPATIRYYLRKFGLSRQPEKKSHSSQFQTGHLDICLCPWCLEILCKGKREEAHKYRRCVVSCVDFKEKKEMNFLNLTSRVS